MPHRILKADIPDWFRETVGFLALVTILLDLMGIANYRKHVLVAVTLLVFLEAFYMATSRETKDHATGEQTIWFLLLPPAEQILFCILFLVVVAICVTLILRDGRKDS